MSRCALMLALLASCKGGSKEVATGSGSGSAVATGSGSGSAAATASGSGSGSATATVAPASAGFATPLRGPFATLAAYCETRPKTDDHSCSNTDVTPTGALPAGLLEAAAIYETNDGSNRDLGCAIALRTSAGWFVGASSAVTCSQPSYIDLNGIDVDTDDAITAVTFDIQWHTKDSDDEAKYKLTALCGVTIGAIPACTPVFLSQCEAKAPVSGCDQAAFELTWAIDGDSATFTQGRTIDNDDVPTGTRTILGRR